MSTVEELPAPMPVAASGDKGGAGAEPGLAPLSALDIVLSGVAYELPQAKPHGGAFYGSVIATPAKTGTPAKTSGSPPELPPKYTVKELTAMFFTGRFSRLAGVTCSQCSSTANFVANGSSWLCGCGAVNKTDWAIDPPPLHKKPAFGPTLSSVRLAKSLALCRVGSSARKIHRAKLRSASGQFVPLTP